MSDEFGLIVGSVVTDRGFDVPEDVQAEIRAELAEREARRIPLGFRAPEEA